MKKMLIVVDMLNDFVHENGALQFPQAREIIPFVVGKVQEYLRSESPVVFVCDCHEEDDKEFERFPKHAVRDTWGSEIIEDLVIFNAESPVFFIDKQRYNGFFNTQLEDILSWFNPEEVEVVGVCTSICVMDTVGGLVNRDYKSVVYKDGVADFDEEAHNNALKRMEALYGARTI